MADLVSIITPCYNGEKYIDRYFKSLLAQTYPNVEVIFVNDGSTDRTEEIARAYGEQLKSRGYEFIYIYQENAGQSAAINQGLKIFKGTYLNWMDSDDYLPADSIENRVRCLEDNPEVGLVLGACETVDDVELKKNGEITAPGCNLYSRKKLIDDFLAERIGFPCCSTMVRSSMFLDSMPVPPKIETPREIGQNLQLFLPIMFNYPIKYIPEVLSYYVVHLDSHSHQRKTFEQRMHIQDVGTATLYSIADRLRTNDEDIKWFRNVIAENDFKNRLEVMQHYRRSDGIEKIVAELKKMGRYDASARKKVMKIKYPIFKNIGDRIWKLRNKR